MAHIILLRGRPPRYVNHRTFYRDLASYGDSNDKRDVHLCRCLWSIFGSVHRTVLYLYTAFNKKRGAIAGMPLQLAMGAIAARAQHNPQHI